MLTGRRQQTEVNISIVIFIKMRLKKYEDSIKAYRDTLSPLDTAEAKRREKVFAEWYKIGYAEGYTKGFAEGLAEGIAMVTRRMLAMGMTADYIADATGLSKKEIKDIADRQEAKGRS